jgi:lipid-A-disaccharide synthase
MTGGVASGRSSPPTVFIVAGEESGDLLAADLMREISARFDGNIRFLGIGGARMAALGLKSLFPIERIQLHGLTEVLTRLPDLIGRICETTAAVVAADPDVLVLVDSPAFNLRVAARVRRLRPEIAIVDYVSPSVWAWAPWRARRMKPSVDRIMAILPFEPEVHRRLGGPPASYVGHPLIERVAGLRAQPGERAAFAAGTPRILLVLPGSRRSEVRRLMARFGKTVALVVQGGMPVEVVLPAVAPLAEEIGARAADWPVKPTIVVGEAAKYAAFRRAHAALAASGTVTVELALAGVPMVVAYRVDVFLRTFKWLLAAHSIVLANLILGENAIPEYLDGDATPEKLAAALAPLLSDTPDRRRQLAAFDEIERRMRLPEGTPSGRAADIVIDAMGARARGARL